MLKNRFQLEQIRPWVGKPIVKILTGMRRTGKSSLLKLLASDLSKQNNRLVLEINLELLTWEPLREFHALHQWVLDQSRNREAAVLIDEIQECEGWEEAISSLLAMERFDIYLTGSNAKVLSSELATKIAGRYIELHVYGLSFSEHLAFRGEMDLQNRDDEFSRYIRYGGLPGIYHFDPEDSPQYLASLYDTILLRDIVERYHVRDVGLLDKIIRFVFDNIGNVTTANSITKFLKSQHLDVSVKTVQAYLKYLENCFALHRIQRFDIKGKQFLEINEKFYLGDIGLRHGLLGYRENDISGLLENIVCLELLRRNYRVSVGKIGSCEVDFIAEHKSGGKLYLQVCYLLATQEVVDREFGSLERIDDNYPKWVLSMDPLFRSERNGIQWKRIEDFLLDMSW